MALSTTNQGLNTNEHYTRGFLGLNLKTMITIIAILEAVTASILLGFYLYFFNSIAENLGPNQANGKVVAAFLLAIISYLVWKTFFATYTIINFVKNAEYNEISANRYIFIALSLSLGGMWTPFILTMLPNTNVQSTINTRYFLTKTYGMIATIGGLIALGVYFLALKVGINRLDDGIIFQSNTIANTLTIVSLVLTLGLVVLGSLSLWTWKQGQKNNFSPQSSDGFFKVISTIWLVIVSCEVLLTFVYAIIRFLTVLSNTFNLIGQSRGTSGAITAFVMFPILIMNIMFQLLYVVWIGYMVHQTIQGLWRPQVTYRTFESLANYQSKRLKTTE